MLKIKIFLKTLLLLAIVSSFLHFRISSFSPEICFWNTGIIFGLFDFLDQNLLSLILISFLSFMLFIFLKQYSEYWEIFVVLAISSLSNVLDRILHGGVCDYIDINIFFNFPIFNLNDIFISIALIIILVIVFYDSIYNKGERS